MRLTILLILMASPVMADPANDMWRSPMWNDAMSSPMWNTDTSSINTRAFNSGFRLGYQSTVQRKTDSLVRQDSKGSILYAPIPTRRH